MDYRVPLALLVLGGPISGCVVLGVRDEYSYDRDKSHAEGAFIPDTYVQKNERSRYLPFVRLDTSRPPHDLVLLTYDQNNSGLSDRYENIELESVQITFDSGEAKTLLSASTAAERQSFPVAKGDDVLQKEAKVVFGGAIDRLESFTLQYSGRAVTANGENAPFSVREYYKYDGKDWTLWTLMSEWAGV
ncbi:MAG: hypothetical protein U0795_17720 [Pirellulales bacterium]